MTNYNAPPPGIKGACIDCRWSSRGFEDGAMECWSPLVCTRTFDVVRGWSTTPNKAVLVRHERGKCGPAGEFFEPSASRLAVDE